MILDAANKSFSILIGCVYACVHVVKLVYVYLEHAYTQDTYLDSGQTIEVKIAMSTANLNFEG